MLDYVKKFNKTSMCLHIYMYKYICTEDLNIVAELSSKGCWNGCCVPLLLMVPLIFQKMKQATTKL